MKASLAKFVIIWAIFMYFLAKLTKSSTTIALNYESSTKTLSGTTTLTSSLKSEIYTRDLREISSDFPVGSVLTFQLNKVSLNFTSSRIESDFIYSEVHDPINSHILTNNIGGKCSRWLNPDVCESCKILSCFPPNSNFRGDGDFCLVADPSKFYSIVTPSNFVYTLDLIASIKLGTENLPLEFNLSDSHLQTSFSKNFAFSSKFLIKFADDLKEYDILSSKSFFVYLGIPYIISNTDVVMLNTFKADWELETCSGVFGSRTHFFSDLPNFINSSSNQTTLAGGLGTSFLKFVGDVEQVDKSSQIYLEKDIFIQFSIYL